MPDPRHSGTFRVLVVDDNPAIHEDFARILGGPADTNLAELEAMLFETAVESEARVDFRIDSARQGEEAIALVARAQEQGEPYAVAFVDMRMPPGIDGVETIACMWDLDPKLQAVICTAYSDRTWESITHTLGNSDGFLVVKKPFDAIEVLQAAHALTRKWALKHEVDHQLHALEATVSDRTRELERSNAELRSEIDRRLDAERNLKHLAMHDSLTGLPNRILMNDRLIGSMARASRHDTRLALLLVDLDRFKDVNDTHGHAAGDQLLVEIAQRLQSCVRVSDTVARMGGDEFVVILEGLDEAEDAALVAERILACCSEPVRAHGQLLRTPPSIGIAIYPTDCSDAETLLKSADVAMYHAKSSGRATYRFYAQELLERSVERATLRSQLESALANEEFELWYQPLVDLTSGSVSGMEALLRWRHPELGMVPPMKFIPTAEKCGLIVDIGRWVLNAACQQLARWDADGLNELSLAVNVSACQLGAPDFVDSVCQALNSAKVAPHRLELEITESAALEDVVQSTKVLQQLADMGVRLVIDDFGAGYSSLNRLKHMPIHALKIDRFFLNDIVDDPRDAAIVLAIVGMAHSLGISVVAEGIERIEQLEFLRGMRWDVRVEPVCDRAQGYLIAKPLPADAATTLLRDGFSLGGSPRAAAADRVSGLETRLHLAP